nr:hypothetical protein [Rhodothalassium salexigens]
MEKRIKRPLNLITADGFALFGAIPREAVIIGVTPAIALRPIAGQRISTGSAADKSAQRKILAEVFPCRCACFPGKPVLDELEGLIADNRLVLSLPQRNIPLRIFEVARIKHVHEQIFDPLVRDRARLRVFREIRLGFEEALYFRLRLKTTACETFQGFLDDRRHGFISDKGISQFRRAPTLKSDRRIERPVTVQ